MIAKSDQLVLYKGIAILLLLTVLVIIGAQTGCEKEAKNNKTAVKRNNRAGSTKRQASDWYKEPGKIRPDVTSTSSLVLPNKIIRTYFVDNGFISFIESEDGTSFGEAIRTNIGTGDPSGGQEIPADPVVVVLRSGRFMMLYNTRVSEKQFSHKPQYTKLHLAYSEDGISFDFHGIVGDLDTNQFAVVNQIDAVVSKEGSIRIYGADNGVSTAMSKDGGKTWITDGVGLIGEGAREPDVHSDRSGKHIMYYSASEERSSEIGTYIGKAESTSGLDWKQTKTDQLAPEKKAQAIFNPDHVVLNAQTEILFYSEGTFRNSQLIRVDWRRATRASQ